jgi:hypothetical protein
LDFASFWFDGHLAARGLDLFPRAPTEAMGGDVQRLAEICRAKYHNAFAPREPALLYDTTLGHQFGRNPFIRLELLVQVRQAYFDPLLFEDVCETALGKPSLQGHLAALESRPA